MMERKRIKKKGPDVGKLFKGIVFESTLPERKETFAP